MKASDYGKHASGKRFHVREIQSRPQAICTNGPDIVGITGTWEVYGLGLDHVCECLHPEQAEMIAEALELKADTEDASLPQGGRK